MDADKLLQERGKTHGDFKKVAVHHISIRQKILHTTVGDLIDGGILTVNQIEALDMIALKIARIVSGGASHKDSWDDIAGYAMLGGADAE